MHRPSQRDRSPDRSPAGAPQIKAGPRKKRGPGKLDRGPVSVPRAGPIIEDPAQFSVRGPASQGTGRGVKFVPRPAPLRTLVLNALNPRKSQSWINLGNAAAHEFTIGEAWCLAEDPIIRRLLHALTSQVGNTVLIQDATSAKRTELGSRMQAVKVIETLPNPNNTNPAISAEIIRLVDEHLQRNTPATSADVIRTVENYLQSRLPNYSLPPQQPSNPQSTDFDYRSYQNSNPAPPGVDLSTPGRMSIPENALMNFVKGVDGGYPYHQGGPGSL